MSEQPIIPAPRALDYFCGFDEFQTRANLVVRQEVETKVKLLTEQRESNPEFYRIIANYFGVNEFIEPGQELPEFYRALENRYRIVGLADYVVDPSKKRVWAAREVRELANFCLTNEITLLELLKPFNFNQADTNYWIARKLVQGFVAGPKHLNKYPNSIGVFRTEQPTEEQILRAFIYLEACEEIDELAKQTASK